MAATHSNIIPTCRDVLESLGDRSYDLWRMCLKSYLLSQDLWDLIQLRAEPPPLPPSWRKTNGAALHAIHISLGPDILHQICEIDSAKEAWDTLADLHNRKLLSKDESRAHGNHELVDTGTMTSRNRASQYFYLITMIREGRDTKGISNFIGSNPESVRFRFQPGQGTSLHLAAELGNVAVAEELMTWMDEEDLEIQDNDGSTALHITASRGHLRVAELMVRKNPSLVTIMNKREMIPLREACGKNHKELATFLYRTTPTSFLCEEGDGKYGADILNCCILGEMFDIALDLLRRRKGMSMVMDASNINVAIQLSTMPDAFPSGSPVVFWMRWMYSLLQVKLPDALYASKRDEVVSVSVTDSSEDDDGFGLMTSPDGDDIIKDVDKYWKSKHGRVLEHNWSNKLHSFILKVTGTKQMHELKRIHICSLELLNLMFKQISRLDFRNLEEMGVYEAFVNAVKNGIVEFVERAIEVCPALLCRLDTKGRNSLMLAVEFRQEKVFNKLLSCLSDIATTVSLADKEGNTLLHLAGMLSCDDTKLSRLSGAALQMQRELHWFLEVERVTNPMYKRTKNTNNETARQIFTRTHKDLASLGEKWMKETATSATVVGALIITIMFTAVFTVPGGNNQETGIPVLLNQWAFKIFVVADSISQFAASTSVLMFLAILTSRYSEADFLRSLPTKMVIGLSMLFISIATMMVAFCATIVMVMDRQLECVVPILLLATVPVSLFMLLQFPLLVEIFLSTYGFGIFKRNTNSLL